MNKSRIRRKNCGLHWHTTFVGQTPVERSLNNVLEVELNFVGFRCIREPIERLLRSSFNTFDNTDDSVNLGLIDQTLRSVNEQPNVLPKFNVRR